MSKMTRTALTPLQLRLQLGPLSNKALQRKTKQHAMTQPTQYLLFWSRRKPWMSKLKLKIFHWSLGQLWPRLKLRTKSVSIRPPLPYPTAFAQTLHRNLRNTLNLAPPAYLPNPGNMS